MSRNYEIDTEAEQINMFDQRWYQIKMNDNTYKYLKGVTTILGIIDKGYNYSEWLKNVGHNAEIIRDRAGTLGTTVHGLIERTLKGESITYDDSIDVFAWERFMRWCELWKKFTAEHEVKIDPELIEFITCDLDLEYAGQVDAPIWVDGELELFDWKTGNFLAKADLQIVAYMRSLEKQLAKPIKRGRIGWMPVIKPNKAGYRIIEVPNNKVLFNAFLSAKALYEYEHQKEEPKYLTYPMMINLDFIKNNEIIGRNPQCK